MQNTSKRYAYSYLRMSTDSQLKGDSRRRQLELSERYAIDNGLTLIESLEDIGVSAFRGKNSKTGAFAQLLKLVEEGRVPPGTVLLVESLDRMSREDIFSAFKQFVNILDCGLTIVTLADGQEYTRDSVIENQGQIYTSLGIMLRANEESATKSKRLSAAWQNKRVTAGIKKLTSRAPAWLTLNKLTNTFEILEPAATTVRQIFALSIEGMGAYGIARQLNLAGTPTLGKSEMWHRSYIIKILNNQSVYGLFQPMKMQNGKRVPEGPAIEDYFPSVVSKDQYLLSQARVRERSDKGGGRQGGQFTNIFTKLARCGDCGSTLTLLNKGEGPKGGRWLRCSKANLRGDCDAAPWKYRDFEADFFHYIKEVDIQSILSESDSAAARAVLEDEKLVNGKLIEELRIKANNLVQLLENSDLTASVITQITQQISGRVDEIEQLEIRNSEIADRLLDIETHSVVDSQNAAQVYFTELINAVSPEALDLARRKVHFGLRNSIECIQAYCRPQEIVPTLTALTLEPRVRYLLAVAGYASEEDIDTFLETAKGAKFFAETSRSFKVIFKNGAVRQVWPGRAHNKVITSQKHAAFLRRRNAKSASD